MDAIKRIVDAGLRGAERGWNPNDPLGYDIDTKIRNRELTAQYPILAPVQRFNEIVGYPLMALGDAALRGGDALLQGGAALAGQLSNEFGPGRGADLTNVEIVKGRAVVCKRIDVRRRQVVVPIQAQISPTLIVSQDHHNVGPVVRPGG